MLLWKLGPQCGPLVVVKFVRVQVLVEGNRVIGLALRRE